MLVLITCLLAAIVFYALHKNYTVRAGGKALGAAFLFEALKRKDEPEHRNRRTLSSRARALTEGQRSSTVGNAPPR